MKKTLLFSLLLLMSFTMAMGQADANGFVTIGTGSQNKFLPIFPFMKYSYSQVIYLQNEINEAGEITKLHYYYSGEGDNQNSKDWVIWMGHTTKTEFAGVEDWVATGDLTEVYNGEVILTNTAGWIEIPLTTPFTYNNTANLVVAVNEITPGQGDGSQSFRSTPVTENRGLRQLNYTENIDPSALGSGILEDGIANIKLLIPKDYAFTVNAPTSESVIIGVPTQYSVTIENIGLQSDSFTPTITGDGLWTYALYQADGITEITGGITIAPGTFAEFIVKVTVPADATMGDTDIQGFTITAAGGSQTTETFSITTTAKVILTAPFFEGFEECVNGQPVALWGQGYVWGTNQWIANSYHTNNNRAPRTGDFNAYLGANNFRWLFTPSYFELSASKTYRFSAYARQDGINPDKVGITLMYGTSATADGMTELAKVQTNIVGDEYQRIEGIFSPTVDGNYYLGILGKISYDGFSNNLSIDDISVEEIEFSVTSPLGVTVDAGMSHDYHVTITNVGHNSDNFTPSIIDGTWTYGLYELNGTTALTGAKTIASGASYEFIARVDVPITANFNDTDNVNLIVTSASGIQAPTTISITTTALAVLPLPFFEGFEDCIDQQAVALWGQVSVTGTNIWKANFSLTNNNLTPRTGNFNAYLAYENTRWLFTPSYFALEASKTYRFSVYARQNRVYADEATITLMYGASATVAGMTGVVKELTEVLDGDYQLIEGTFSPLADGNYYFGILGEVTPGYNFLSIDDISIAEVFDNDAALINITSPADIVEFNAAHDFMVTLKNNGENNLTALGINWSIGNPAMASGVYNWTGNLARGEEAEVTLTNYTFATPGDIAISATIDWAADMVGNNNTIEKSIYVEAQKCDYTINLADSYGDGWNGAVIGFKQKGVIVGTFGETFTSGSTFGPISVDLEEDIETQIVVVNHNYAVAQIGFTVTDPFDYMVFHRATGTWFDTDKIFHTFTSSCQESTPHTITLTVADTEGPIKGAILTFNGIAQTTGADGIVTITDVIDGTYAYSITKYGYVSTTGNMIVAGADVTETITLDHVTYSVIFTVVDVSDASIEGATITINGIDHTTNTEGVVVVTGIIEGSHSYTATKAGYTIETGSMFVNGPGLTKTITLYPVYTITITVVDGATPIEGAVVSFYGIEQATGSTGIVTFTNIPNGTNNYSVTKAGYVNATGDIVVDGADVAKTITLNLLTYTLTFTAGVNGSITGEASQTVNHGANGTPVTAVAVDGYHFVKWSDGVETASRTDKNVTANITAEAEFAINTYTLTYTAGANGSITGEASQTVNHGANGTPVTAVAVDGYHFVKWSDGVETASRTDKNVTANITAEAEFAINTYTLTYTAGANGSITGEVSQTVNHGDNGTSVNAVAVDGHHFVKWSDGVTENPRTDKNVTTNVSVVAEFGVTASTYTLTYIAGANGSITGEVSQTVDHGANGTPVTAEPNDGYHFVKWSDGLKTASRTDKNVISNIAVTAEFANAPMVLEFNTNKSDGTTIYLPLYGTVDVTVDWGDESSDAYTTEGNHAHEYAAEGTYTVSITGTLTHFGATYTNSANMDKLVKVTSFGDIGLTSLKGAFWKATNLWKLPSELPSTITNLGHMLFGASKFDGDIGSWDVSQVTNMDYMFCGATKFNQNISSWNVSSVTGMNTMFSGAKAFNQNIGGWDVSKITNMTGMFYATPFNQDIGSWNVSGVTKMERMFSSANAFNQNIGGWDVSNVTDMTNMFEGVTLSTANYNNLLIGWAAQTVQNGVNFHGGNSKYSPGAAADARAVLTGPYSWIITDGGVLNVLTVLTIAPSEITATTATSGGNITADGGSPVTARGVVWGTTENPTIETNTGITSDGTGLGTFTSSITGLTENATYHVRAYATNSNGTEYGENMEFKTKEESKFTVTFSVTDNVGPVAEATVNINEQMLTTNTDGVAVFANLINGTYNYTVTKEGYVVVSGNVVVDGADVDKTITLNPLTYNVTLTIVDGKAALIEGAIITFNGVGKTTDANGKVVITSLINGTYAYTITKVGYVDATGEIVVTGADIAKTITLNLKTYNVTLTVVDGKDAPIEGATITFNGADKTTDAEGKVVITDLVDGAYAYNVTKTGYVDATGEIIVDGADVDQKITLSPTTGIDTGILSNLKAYPNPFNKEINITNADKVKRVIITNIVGQRVMDITLNGNGIINTSKLTNGVYLVAFEGINGERIVRKMIKK